MSRTHWNGMPGVIGLLGLVLPVIAVLVWPAAAAAADDNKFVRVDRVFGAAQPEMFVEDEFIVVLRRDARPDIAVGQDGFGLPTVSLPSVQDVIDQHGVSRFARQFPTAQSRPVDSKYPDLTGHYKVKIDAGIDLDTAMAAFARDPGVDHVEKIGIHQVYSCATGTPLTPNDTWFNNPPSTFPYPQWDLWDTNGIDAELAWSVNTGDATVVVVAMDTGVRYFHKDLGGNDPPGPADNVTDGNVWVNPFEIPNNGIDDEGNGKVDDVVGWDFVTGVTGCSSGEDCSTQDNDPRDFNGHGTHTAGTMAAITNNARGIAGIAGGFGTGSTSSPGNGSKIMCMRIGWSTPFGGFVRMDFAAQAMNYVADMKNRGVNIAAVNASWGSSNSGGLDAAVNNLLAADVMLIHAAGNSGSSTPDYLGSKAGVMNVAATDKNGNKASFSNFGSWVDIAAPGVDIISTYHSSSDPANDYVSLMSGTSMSAPHVTAVAGLLESCNNGLSGPDKFSIMVNSGCLAGSFNIGDILNAKLALDAVPGGCGGCTSDLDCDDGNVCNGLETCDMQSGQCVPGTPVNCTPSDACHVATCDPLSGCGEEPINCDDDNECTNDACVGGTCQNTPLADNTACTGGVCCGSTCTAPACSGDDDCDDADTCTTDTCTDPGLCSATCSNDPVVCSPGETCVNGVCEPEVCNNDGTCDPGEDCNNCANDCISGGGGCGDGVCEGNIEDCFSCPGDCRCAGGGGCNHCCGDNACTGSENQNNCPVDCDPGFVPPTGFCCGNGICEAGEDSVNCEVDCAGCIDDTDCAVGVNCCSGVCTMPVCSVNGDCDDGDVCSTDTCMDAGMCAAACSNTFPACGAADGCCGPDCDANDPDCVACGGNKAQCNVDADCCSGNCKDSTCRGN